MTEKAKKWSDEAVAQLTNMVGGQSPVSVDTVEHIAETLGFTTRSVASKLRQLDYDVASMAKEKTSAFTPEEGADLADFYASRMGNGPTESGEGWKYRGRGLKQLTGKDNYTRCGQAIEANLVAEPDLLINPKYAALSAAWFWSVNKCGALAESGDFVGLTKKINGGTIGLEDREKRYRAVLAIG